ncbi:MAG: HEPN domain-containing protein [Acidimicrobiia bacterium]|nr:HEPN domain-containing protein [Acidimicrobiia bacterium]MYF26294.1 HEPN domain-containing protein [Acidimicrobiia bacterium]
MINRMSELPANTGDKAAVWIERAGMLVESAGFAAERSYWPLACHQMVLVAELAIKAAYIAEGATAPRSQDIVTLLADCPAESIKEQINQSLGDDDLDRFTRYNNMIHPYIRDADQDSYTWCQEVADLVRQIVEKALALLPKGGGLAR